MPEDKVREVLEKVLPDKVAKEVSKVIRDGGIRVTHEPKTVVRPEPIFRDGKIDGGMITVKIEW